MSIRWLRQDMSYASVRVHFGSTTPARCECSSASWARTATESTVPKPWRRVGKILAFRGPRLAVTTRKLLHAVRANLLPGSLRQSGLHDPLAKLARARLLLAFVRRNLGRTSGVVSRRTA